MNLNQYTVKSQEAIQAAQQVAMEFGNQRLNLNIYWKEFSGR
jgi:ATP-dependent Clp protease ATP-binding subunit ClpB